MSPRLGNRSFSCCSKEWCAARLSRLLMVPECIGALPVSDARSSGQDALPPRNAENHEGEREMLDEIAAMQYRIVGCLDENGLTRSGEDGASLMAVVRKNIEEGAPPFARGRFVGLNISLDEWGASEEYAKLAMGQRKSAKKVAAEEAMNRDPARSILRKGGKRGGPEKAFTFARDLSDIVPVASWKRYEL